MRAVIFAFLFCFFGIVAEAETQCLCENVALSYSEDPVTFPGEEIITIILEKDIGVEGGNCQAETRYQEGTAHFYFDTYPSGEKVEISKILFINLEGSKYWVTLEEMDMIGTDICFGSV